MTPEEKARQQIDLLLQESGWIIQDRSKISLSAGPGVAIREALLKTGEADYLLFAGGKAIATVEAKPEGYTLTGVEEQSGKYAKGLLDIYPKWGDPLPFAYESTGSETRFTNRLDPNPASRSVFAFHRPETLIEWASQPAQLNMRLGEMPPLITGHLWQAQIEAIQNLEKSLAQNRPRALIQMATGSGKTFTAVNFVYRLIKYAGARRILFLFDRSNLGDQTLKEFQQFVTPDDGRKFTELYNIQHLQSSQVDTVSRVTISTIQRLYSMLQGQELDPELDEVSGEGIASIFKDPLPVTYNPKVPIETFDFIVTDECHRSIYNLWRQVLEYFDAYLIGLTATPNKQTFGFFQQNLVQEYGHERVVADGVNVNYDVYQIRTEITARGSQVEKGFYVDRRNRQTRKVRWLQLDEDLSYDPQALDRAVVAPDQIRTVIRAFHDRLFTEIFPGRTTVPKTLIFAKDDSHADDIVKIVREEFGKGNDFCQKITYRTTGAKPEDPPADSFDGHFEYVEDIYRRVQHAWQRDREQEVGGTLSLLIDQDDPLRNDWRILCEEKGRLFPKGGSLSDYHRSPSLTEQYSQNSSPCWRPDAEPIVRFWMDDGTCVGIPFFSVAGCLYDPNEQALSIALHGRSIIIAGPKTGAFFDAFCKQRATQIRADGVDIVSVRFILDGMPAEQPAQAQEAVAPDPRAE